MSHSSIRLGDPQGKLTMLEIACRRCERHGKLRLQRLVAKHGAGMDLPTLGTILAGDCPRVRSVGIYDRCGVHFPQLPRLFGYQVIPNVPDTRPAKR
jgi:hypothetical protein